ncbi:MAG: DUF99 family protein [archaeon]
MRTCALDDGPFLKGSASTQTLLIACIMDQYRILRLASTTVTIDGKDGTRRAMQLLRRCGDHHVVLLPSVSLAGFNAVDPFEINKVLGVPVIIANPQKPRPQLVRRALREHFDDWAERIRVFERTSLAHRAALPGGGVLHYCAIGLDVNRARLLLRTLTVFGNTPEPLRVSRIFARALGRRPLPQVSRGMGKKRGHQ